MLLCLLVSKLYLVDDMPRQMCAHRTPQEARRHVFAYSTAILHQIGHRRRQPLASTDVDAVFDRLG
jgi:hypothetical protein